jgi:predicted NUDIX family NTP pyrophosphohydrolase
VEVLLVHPGGPIWARRDDRAWSIPKGELGPDEPPLAAARREFTEELGVPAPSGPLLELGEIRQPGGKRVWVWAADAPHLSGVSDRPLHEVASNRFEMEWPPRSGRVQSFPEVDRAEWFGLEVARAKLHAGQVGFVDRLVAALDRRAGEGLDQAAGPE